MNGTDWPGHKHRHSSTTRASIATIATAPLPTSLSAPGSRSKCTAWAWPIADYNNDGFPDILITAVGQNRLFQNTGKGTFIDVTKKAGLGGRTGFSTSALGSITTATGCSTCSSAITCSGRPSTTSSAASTARRKSYCTPEAYHGSTCWLFRNRGNGTFEDVTAKSGIFDTTSKSLGVAMLDYDHDGWPDLFVANDTQPNKLYRNRRDGTFEDVAVRSRRGVQRGRQGARRHGRRRGRFRELRRRRASPSPTSTTR